MLSDRHDSPNDLNPYAPPADIQDAAPQIVPLSESELLMEELRAFVGRREGYYLKSWTPLIEGRASTAVGFNWAALLFSTLWLPYRKMYKVAAIFYGAIIVESILEELLFVGILGYYETPLVVSNGMSLVFAIVCGAFGNTWYYRHAASKVVEVRAEGFDGAEHLRLLARRGGTSILMAFACFFLFVFLIISIAFVQFVIEEPTLRY